MIQRERVEYLEHHGILGQKWGVRRFQNEDGTLTEAGKKRYGTSENYDRYRKERKAKRVAIVKTVGKEVARVAVNTAISTAISAGTMALGANAARNILQYISANTHISNSSDVNYAIRTGYQILEEQYGNIFNMSITPNTYTQQILNNGKNPVYDVPHSK